MLAINTISAVIDPFDFSKIKNISRKGPILLDKLPPQIHTNSSLEPITQNDSTLNKSMSMMEKIMDKPSTRYLFIGFIILIVAMGFYAYYKYSQGGGLTFDKDFGG